MYVTGNNHIVCRKILYTVSILMYSVLKKSCFVIKQLESKIKLKYKFSYNGVGILEAQVVYIPISFSGRSYFRGAGGVYNNFVINAFFF